MEKYIFRGGKRVSKKKKIWISLGVLVLIGGMFTYFFLKGNKASTVDTESPEDMEILVQEVSEEKLEESILVTGKIVPHSEQKVFLDEDKGEIQTFKVKENKTVKKGDPLFVYDGTKVENDYNAALRARDLVQNSVKAEQNQINKVTNDIQKIKKEKNSSSDSGITNEDIRQLELEKDQLVLELENTKAEVAAAQADIDEMDRLKKSLTVTAKMDGTVIKVNKNLEKSYEATTEPVVHIVSKKPFKVIGTMSEFDAVKIKKKQKVIIRPKVYKDREWGGEVQSVSQFPSDNDMGEMDMYGGGDSNVTMYPFTVKFTDDTEDLRQGFHVSLEVSVGGDEEKMVVPHSAILDDMMMGLGEEEETQGIMDEMFGSEDVEMMEESPFVYVLVDDTLKRRDVITGKSSDEFIEIIDGVELGELVVITPTFEMDDGMEVTSYDEVE